jgi:shikimate 5-dehydrogenase
MLTKVALIGRPVAQTLWPRRQNEAFDALRLDRTSPAFDVGDPIAAVDALRNSASQGPT